MDFTELELDVSDRVLTITLDRPDRLNAFTYVMHEEVIRAFDIADDDPGIRAVIVTGKGRGFCAGADLEAGGATFTTDNPGSAGAAGPHRDEGGLVTLRIFRSTKPVIAAINGPAVGVGATMTLPMDIRLASETSKFGFVFARRGLVPEAASSWFLPRVVGVNTALEWTFTGRVFGPDEALRAGLVSRVLPPDDLLAAARELAAEIADNTSATSVAMTRQMLWRMLGADHPMRAHEVDSNAIARLGRSADVREGVMSFLEKRPPAFTDQVPADIPPPWPFWTEPEFEEVR